MKKYEIKLFALSFAVYGFLLAKFMEMKEMSGVNVIAVIFYFAFGIFIGMWGAKLDRKVETQEDIK